ncbi:hypothetical protein, partial [Rhodococcus aetherivorans]|uniref:hypothetical protein n=2 Tax=Rhodococcus aetherivorans TaxID=191292 RepID=UPI0031ED00D9
AGALAFYDTLTPSHPRWIPAQRHREEIEAAENRLQAQLDAAAAQSAHDTQVAEDRHARELEAANARADRQIKAEWYREQAQVVRDLWGTVNKATVPTLMLAQRIDEHNAFYQKISSDTLAREPLVSKVSNAYTTWWTHYLDVQGAIAVAEMLIEDQVIRGQLNTLRDRVEDHMRYAMLYKEAAINNGGGAGVSTFPATINGFIKLRDPMMSEIHRLLTSTDGQHV